MTSAARTRSVQRLASAVEGATAIEYVIVLCCITLGSLGGWVALGGAVDAKVQCAVSAIGGAGPCGAGGTAIAAARTTPSERTAIRGDSRTARRAGRSSSLAATAGARAGRTVASSLGRADDDSAPLAGSSRSALTEEELPYRTAVAMGELWEYSMDAGDEDVTVAELEALARDGGGPAASAARFLLERPSVLRSVTMSDGDGDNISADDFDYASFLPADFASFVADTASGRGRHDDHASRSDWEAVRDDASLPPSMRARARRELARMPKGCGTFDVGCRAGGLVHAGYDRVKGVRRAVLHAATGTFDAVRHPLRTLERLAMSGPGTAYAEIVGGFVFGLIDGVKNTVVGTAQGGVALVRHVVAHPLDSYVAAERFMLDPVFRARAVYAFGKNSLLGVRAYVEGRAGEIAHGDRFEKSHAVGETVSEVLLMVVGTKGAGATMRTVRAAGSAAAARAAVGANGVARLYASGQVARRVSIGKLKQLEERGIGVAVDDHGGWIGANHRRGVVDAYFDPASRNVRIVLDDWDPVTFGVYGVFPSRPGRITAAVREALRDTAPGSWGVVNRPIARRLVVGDSSIVEAELARHISPARLEALEASGVRVNVVGGSRWGSFGNRAIGSARYEEQSNTLRVFVSDRDRYYDRNPRAMLDEAVDDALRARP